MKVHFFWVSMSLLLPVQAVSAAALEQSGQSMHIFFQPDHYAEISLVHLEADVAGQVENQAALAELGIHDYSTGNLAPEQRFVLGGFKLQLNPEFSFALLYDQPFGVKVNYNYNPDFYGQPLDVEAADIRFKTENISALVGYHPDTHWTFYAGLSHQSFQGNLELWGQNYYIFHGYQAHFPKDDAWGWLAGVRYQIPEYAMSAAFTYRSAIHHKLAVQEQSPQGQLQIVADQNTVVRTPESLNLDLHTGISANNLLYAGIRWVNWKDFYIQPTQFGAVIDAYATFIPEIKDFKLIHYQKDQWSAKLGGLHRWNARWISQLELGWDSGIGNPASTLNPADGHYSLGLGQLFYFRPDSFIAAGAYYLKFKQPHIQPSNFAGTQISNLASVNRDNHAWVYGLRFGHHF